MIRYEKGLSQNTIQCIMQDKMGFMWFGTWDGLNKFDGYTFSVWNIENGLSNQIVQALAEDHDGMIWIGTEDGLNMYDRMTDEITIFRHDHRDRNSLVHNSVRTLSVDLQGDIWIGTNRGVSVYRKRTGTFENYRHDIRNSRSLINNWINDIFCDSQGRIWIGTYKGLELFDPDRGEFIHFNRSTGWDSIALKPVLAITEDSLTGLWFINRDGLFNMKHDLSTLKRIDLQGLHTHYHEQTQVENMVFDDLGKLWIGTARHGVMVFEPVVGELKLLQHDRDNPMSISNDQIYSIYVDRSGIIWVGTFSGVNKYDRHSSKFRHYRQLSEQSYPLLSDVIFGFHEDTDGTILIGTEKGISTFDPVRQVFGMLRNSLGKPDPLIRGLVRTFHKDKDGRYWIGTTGGMVRYDPETGQTKTYNASGMPGNTLISNFVRKIVEDPEGYLWVGTELGLCRFNKRDDTFVCFQHEENNPHTLPDNTIFDLLFDSSGRLWVATADGLCWYNSRRQRFIPAIRDAQKVLTPNQRRIASILESEGGIFWVGTMGGGLMRYNSNNGSYRFYTQEHGLPNNVVYTIIDDQMGNLWVPTNRGLARFSIANESFVSYGIKDGIQSSEFNLGASLKTRDGRILFGGMNGFNSFYPEEIRQNTQPPRIAVSGFYVFDKLIRRELFDGDTIRLKYGENFFAFQFTALDFANPSKNQYRYYLHNFERGWINTDANDRTAIYTNVPPGRYIFKVKGSNNDGIWNEQGVSITVIISPPWYATWLFRGSALVFFIFGIYIMVRGRIRHIHRKHLIEKQFLEMEKQHSDLEQKALRLQMNPHFIFNTLNSIQSYMINNEAETAIDYLAKFARLMRLVLSNSSESYIAVKEELSALEYYLEIEQLRFEDKFTYQLHVDPAIDVEFTGIPPMIIQPYVENAIIHGLMYKDGGGQVVITLTQQPDHIFCVIEDDGVGREKAAAVSRASGLERKSSGMIITQQRLDILNRNKEDSLKVVVIDKNDDGGAPTGTRVEIHMPMAEL